MGKEWLNWGGGGSRKSAKRGRFSRDENIEAPPPSGCMCAVLQIFDLNHFQLSLHNQPSFNDTFLQDELIVNPKGVEAPRNSLELEEPSCEAASLSSAAIKDDAHLNLPMPIQIRTSCDTKSPRDSTSESCSSPASRTPGVVARLMGLDLLPESGSPSLSLSRHSTTSPLIKSRVYHKSQNRNEDRARNLLQSNKNVASGAHSLPVTPRVSTTRRSDADHRLSLQISKENGGEEFDLSAYIAQKVASKREATQGDESRSPSLYAKQIVKQVKESISRRKFGVDITNDTTKHRSKQAKEEQIVLVKGKKTSDATNECRPGKHSTVSRSPRARLSYTKNKSLQISPDKTETSRTPKFISSPLVPSENITSPNQIRPNVQPPYQQIHQEKSVKKCEKVFKSSLKKAPQNSDAVRNKKEESFVHSPSKNNQKNKICSKRIPLSSELLNNNVPTLLSMKKDPSPATQLAHKQLQVSDTPTSKRSTQLPSCASQLYCSNNQPHNPRATATTATATGLSNIPDRCHDVATSSSGGAEYHQYIQTILKRTGIINTSIPVLSSTKWYSPTHPLDPANFHYIELFHHTNHTIFTAQNSKLRHRSNRKLIFQLVDELLAEILKPWIKPFSQHYYMDGSKLMDVLWCKIQEFPSAKCEILEDIDGLIDKDLSKWEVKWFNTFEEDEESLVAEIEGDILESLVHEIAVDVFGHGTSVQLKSVRTRSDWRSRGLFT